MAVGNPDVAVTAVRLFARAAPYVWRSGVIKRLYHRRPRLFLLIAAVPLCGAVYGVAASTSRVPYSDRLHLTFLSADSEKRMGERTYKEIVAAEGARILPQTHAAVVNAKRVAADLLRVAANDGYIERASVWTVDVIDSAEANAFVLPSNRIFIYGGLFPRLRTNSGLALVLGHELAHNIAHHANEKLGVMSALIVLADFAHAFNDSASSTPSSLSSLVSFAALTLLQTLLPLAHSRSMESEADQIGLTLMAKAAYDPGVAVAVWKAMSDESGERSVELLSTHPAYETRLENMHKWTSDAQKVRAAAVRELERSGKRIPDANAPLVYTPAALGSPRHIT